MSVCNVLRLGRVDYGRALDFQKQCFDQRKYNLIEDVLLLVEHPPTYTIGRRGNGENLLISPNELEKLGIGLYWIRRGGDVTYHGPGQIVGYPILDLKMFKRDINLYLRQLEDVLLLTLNDFGIVGSRKVGFTGVWVNEEKIGSIGVSLNNWITMHGFALNVNTDLSYFDKIVPCGIKGKSVTSIERLLSKTLELAVVEDSIILNFCKVFNVEAVPGGDKMAVKVIGNDLGLTSAAL